MLLLDLVWQFYYYSILLYIQVGQFTAVRTVAFRSCSCFLLGTSSASCSHGSFSRGQMGRKSLFLFLSFSPCLSLSRVRVSWVKAAEVIVTLLTIYILCEHARKGGRACFFFQCACVRAHVRACSHVVFAFLLWLFPYPICPSFNNKGFSSALCLCSHTNGKCAFDFYPYLHEWKCERFKTVAWSFKTCFRHHVRFNIAFSLRLQILMPGLIRVNCAEMFVYSRKHSPGKSCEAVCVCMYIYIYIYIIAILWVCADLAELGSGCNLWSSLHHVFFFSFLSSSVYTLIFPRCFLCVSRPPPSLPGSFFIYFVKE